MPPPPQPWLSAVEPVAVHLFYNHQQIHVGLTL